MQILSKVGLQIRPSGSFLPRTNTDSEIFLAVSVACRGGSAYPPAGMPTSYLLWTGGYADPPLHCLHSWITRMTMKTAALFHSTRRFRGLKTSFPTNHSIDFVERFHWFRSTIPLTSSNDSIDFVSFICQFNYVNLANKLTLSASFISRPRHHARPALPPHWNHYMSIRANSCSAAGNKVKCQLWEWVVRLWHYTNMHEFTRMFHE